MDLTSNPCPRCGRALSSDARFCDSCGIALGVESAPLPEETLPANSAGAAASAVTNVEEASAPVWAPAGESQPLAGEITEAAPAPAPEQVAYPLRPSVPRAEVRYAGFWRRALALALDIFVLASVYTLLLEVELVPELPTEIVLGEVTPAHRVLAVMALIYFVIMEASPVQATLGKRALELAVTDLSGNRISFWRSLGRNLGKILSEIILLLGFVMAAFTSRKQALHDLIAGCVVIRRQ